MPDATTADGRNTAGARQWPRVAALLVMAGFAFAPACQMNDTQVEDARVLRYEQRMDNIPVTTTMPVYTPFDAPAPVELSGDVSSADLSLETAIWLGLPDPSMSPTVLTERLKNFRFGQAQIRREYERIFENTNELVLQIARPRQYRLSLNEALRRALHNNYAIQFDGYAPAISTAQVVQAEAVFDTIFFANVSRDNTDRPTPSQLAASQTDTTVVAGGIRKLLATGAQATLTQQMVRVDNPGFQFQTLNPAWTQNFVAELRQPLLRNFGIDFNRAQINIRKLEREINEEAFRARVIDILFQTEQAYWQLVALRRDVVITAELLAQARVTYEQIEARIVFDVYRTLLYRAEANVKQQEFAFIDVKNRVRNAEDVLLNLINDPQLPLSADLEIIPVDGPSLVEIVRDRYEAVQTALEYRPEIAQARLAVDVARIQLGIAKNQALPTLDVIYRMTLNGLGDNADKAFDQMTTGNFIDQFIGMEFAWTIGERLERAGIRIATFQQSQAVLQYKQALDNIIQDVRTALRNLDSNYEQILPSYQGMIAAAENLRSIQERQETKSPAELDAVLNAQTNLSNARRALLQAAVQYNIGLADVERAKGTLLTYNNVVLAEEP